MTVNRAARSVSQPPLHDDQLGLEPLDRPPYEVSRGVDPPNAGRSSPGDEVDPSCAVLEAEALEFVGDRSCLAHLVSISGSLG